MFWYYTAYNAQQIYTLPFQKKPARGTEWSAVALGGAVSTLIMILATLAEFSYVPTTWNNTSHLARRLLFLFVMLALTAGPSIYIFFVAQPTPDDDAANPWNISVIIGIVQFVISVCATVLFSVVPSGRLFGDKVAGKARKYLASQTFTASYPKLVGSARWASFGLWFLVFVCKFSESYFFLTLSFKNPVRAMTGMRIQNCNDKLFGNSLCRYQANFTLAMMFFMDLTLFFLDTFLW